MELISKDVVKYQANQLLNHILALVSGCPANVKEKDVIPDEIYQKEFLVEFADARMMQVNFVLLKTNNFSR